MAVPTTTLWAREPHTAAKHQMLSGYLQAWFPIIASTFGSGGLTYVDTFAGPGEYTGHELGSPLWDRPAGKTCTSMVAQRGCCS